MRVAAAISTWLTFAKGARLHPMEAKMHTLLSVLAVGLLVLVAAPQNALACHKGDPGIPHGAQTSCDGPLPPSGDQDFFLEFNDGDVVILGTSGPLTVTAECFLDQGGINSNVRIRVTSSEADWFAAQQSGPLAANVVVTVATGNANGPLYNNATAVAVNAVSPSGHYIGSNNFGMGFNIFDSNCVVAGQIITAQAP